MRKLTTIDVIRALPIDLKIKEELIGKYNTFDEDSKLEVSEICWNAFHEMKRHIESYWRDRITYEIANGQRSADIDLEQQLYDEVWNEIENRVSGKLEDDTKLASVRQQLEKLMNVQQQ